MKKKKKKPIKVKKKKHKKSLIRIVKNKRKKIKNKKIRRRNKTKKPPKKRSRHKVKLKKNLKLQTPKKNIQKTRVIISSLLRLNDKVKSKYRFNFII